MGRRIIEGTWDCSHCGNKKILARYKNCTSCGAPQGKDTNYELPDKITYLSEQEASKISREPDWLCSYCEQLNKSTDISCKGCGATKEDSEKNYFQMKAEREQKKQEIRNQENQFEKEAYGENDSFNYPKNKYDKVNSINSVKNSSENFYFLNFFKIFLGFILIALSIWGLIFLFTPKEDTLNVTELSWSRNISIEKEKTVKEDDWYVPNGGRVYDSRKEIHHHEDVLDHYETVEVEKSREVIDHYEEVVIERRDLGNGYFEEITDNKPIYKTEYYKDTEQKPVYRQEPVYKTKYYYEIDKWFHERDIKTSGIDKEPYWGEVILANKERESGRQENYKIKAINKKEKEKEYYLDYSDWTEINVGDNLDVVLNLFGGIEEIKRRN